MSISVKSGFTIVELLIVIVVISVLASITVVAFNGVQAKSRNVARFQEMKSWDKLFKAYKATYGSYPPTLTANTMYCLGTGFPVGAGGAARCRDYQQTDPAYSYLESANTSTMDELRKIGSLPKNDRTPVNNSVGPYMMYYGSGSIIYRIYGIFNGSTSADCPYDSNMLYTSAGLVTCAIDATT